MTGPRSGGAGAWPSSHDFVEAIQNPRLAFRNPELQRCQPALDRFGLPLVASGNFAYAFKLREPANQRAVGVRCFRGLIPDRDRRYELIDRHLRTTPAPALASFVFEPDGILVGGRRFPVVVMEWIEGPTLDLYLAQALSNKAALQSLADQWLGMVQGLRRAGIAHGDLQHGNVIVHDGRFRLIDLDAMFVPAMQGWRSNELGHAHFQHPRRDLDCFDAGIDNFSALVIYLSIVALAEAPQLWQRYHDENLIFVRQDFLDPAASPLFADLRGLGGLPRRLAEALQQAARAAPAATPWIADLVAPQSRLPAWMTQPAGLKIEVKTREAAPGTQVAATPAPAGSPARGPPSPWPSWHPAGQAARPPAAPPPAAVPAVSRPGVPLISLEFNWQQVHQQAAATAIAWYLAALILVIPLSALTGHFLPWAFAALLGSAAGGYLSAARAELRRLQRLRQVIVSYPVGSSIPGLILPATVPPAPARTQRLRIGDRQTRVYHRPACPLVPAGASRAVFASSGIARAYGYAPCPNCGA